MQKIDDENFSYWGLAWLLAFSPLVRGGHQGWAMLLMTAGMGCLLVLSFLGTLWKGKGFFVWSLSDLLILLGLFWIVVSLRRSLSPPDAIDAFLVLLGCVLCFFLTRHLSFSNRALSLSYALCLVAGLVALVGLFQVLGFLPHGWWKPKQFMASTFANHNHFAAYLELIFPVGCLLCVTAPVKPAGRFFLIVSSVLMGIGLLLSCSRGAWLSLVLSFLFLVLGVRFKRSSFSWNWKKLAVLAASFLALGFLAVQPPIFSRALSLLDVSGDTSFQIRQAIWQGTWGLAKENLFFGQGAGSFLFTFTRYRPSGLYWLINYAHNEYLQLIAEFGLVGLGLILAGTLPIFRRMVRLVRGSQTSWKQALGLGGLLGMTSFAIHSLIDFHWHIPAVLYQASAVAGMAAGVSYHSDSSPLRILKIDFANSGWRSPRGIIALGIITLALVASLPLGFVIAADVFAQRGDFEKAVRFAPYRTGYYEKMGWELAKRGRRTKGIERHRLFKRAAEAYRQSLELVPHNARSAYHLAGTLKTLVSFREADQWFEKAVNQDPRNPVYWKDWGELKLLKGEPDEAARSFRRAAELARPHRFSAAVFNKLDDPAYFVERGKSELGRKHTALAETLFKTALEFDTQNTEAKSGLALSALKAGSLEKARERLQFVEDPALKAEWYAVLAQEEIRRGERSKARRSLETSLRHDSTHLLARHLEVVLAGMEQDESGKKRAIEQLILLNRSPVFVKKGDDGRISLVWEPENGVYKKGQKIYEGWALFGKGTLRQSFALPPGRVKFRVRTRGDKAEGVGPILKLSWEGRLVLTTEVTSKEWVEYGVEIKVKPGETLFGVTFPNDFRDKVTGEDRNLRIDKVTATWEMG